MATAILTPWIAPTVPVRAAAVGGRVRSSTTSLTSPPPPPPPPPLPLPPPPPQPPPQEQPNPRPSCSAQKRDTVLSRRLTAKWTIRSQSPSQNQRKSESLPKSLLKWLIFVIEFCSVADLSFINCRLQIIDVVIVSHCIYECNFKMSTICFTSELQMQMTPHPALCLLHSSPWFFLSLLPTVSSASQVQRESRKEKKVGRR